jgi:N-acetylglutamate synthase-like GNAT family acetyltransferase
MFQIRRIKPEDIDFVIKLIEECGISQGKLLSNIEGFLICENNNTRCGCGCLTAKGGEGFIYWIAVNEGSRGNGLGAAITKALLNIADHNGLEEVYAPGKCPDFLKALGFKKADCEAPVDRARVVLGVSEDCEYYMVPIKGYFKPCSQK